MEGWMPSLPGGGGTTREEEGISPSSVLSSLLEPEEFRVGESAVG